MDWKLIAVMIDGVHFADHVVLAAIGIDAGGKKHTLGLREGATENAAAWSARTRPPTRQTDLPASLDHRPKDFAHDCHVIAQTVIRLAPSSAWMIRSTGSRSCAPE